MNIGCIVGGIVLMAIAFLGTIFTLGLGFICTGPLGLIGFLLFIIGFFISEREKQPVYNYYPAQQTPNQPIRNCPSCGRSIPMDAQVCPYCGKDFRPPR